jgi:6-phosphogluconolactonase
VPNIQIFETRELLARAAAQHFVSLAQAAAPKGRFSVALSGGTTPRRVYELLASDEFKNQVDWRLVHLFFGDERTVPPDHPDSNYGMAKTALISRVPLPASNVHPMPGVGDPGLNAKTYEGELKSFFTGAVWPRFDLVFLGMGDDGHTASLFPGTAAVKEDKAWVIANWVERLGEFRMTLTAPVINAAMNVVVLVTGEKKAARLAKVLYSPREPQRLPIQLIEPTHGSLLWMIDAAAATQFKSSEFQVSRDNLAT